MEKKKPTCDHQLYDSGDPGNFDPTMYNYCPWCGEYLWIKVDDKDDREDDCIKGGCAD